MTRVQSTAPASVQHAVVSTADRFPLAARVHPPSSAARATLLVHGATATPQAYYGRFATFLAQHGVRVVTYDYRGVGGSRPGSLRGFEATMRTWGELDAVAMHRFVRARFSEPLVTVGHSFGGQLLGLADEVRDVDGIVLAGAQLGYMGHWPARSQARLALVWYGMVPTMTRALGYLPAWTGIGEDLPSGVAREWATWCRSPNYFLDHVPEARARLAAVDRPILAFSTTDDEFAPAASVDALLAVLPHGRVEHRRLSPSVVGSRVGHFGFFRPAATDAVWSEILAFVDRTIGARTTKSAA